MTTLLAPTYSLRIGSQIWKEQLLRLELTLTAAPGIDILSAVLPALAPLDAAVDDDVELTLDSGEQGRNPAVACRDRCEGGQRRRGAVPLPACRHL
jgi:hypothetical protein